MVGASTRPASFGRRVVDEISRSPSRPEIHLVNPSYTSIDGRLCVASLDDVPGPVDLVLLGVPDSALESELAKAAEARRPLGGDLRERVRGRRHLFCRPAG